MDLAISLDRTSNVPMHQQLSEKLRQVLWQGDLKPGQRLPPSRVLAKSLEISRTTVAKSYDQLLGEGYLEARPGSGTFVNSQLLTNYLDSGLIEQVVSELSDTTVLSQFGKATFSACQTEVSETQYEISFRFSSPAVEQFPIVLWRRLLSRHCNNCPAVLDYSPDAAGYFPLRTAIANYLGRIRAAKCSAEQIIIVNGSQQALNLITRLTIDRGDWVAMEDPGYLCARNCFEGQGAKLQAVTVDSDGLNVKALERYSQSFKLLYITPSHQFPTGVTLSLSRRLALLQWAYKTGTLLLEHDYDSEYRYGMGVIPALQGFDQNNTVVYVGTFSKTLFPSLRIGYLVVPPEWIELVTYAKWLCDRQTPILEQYALTDFLTEGHFERHIQRMRYLYDKRRKVLIKAIKEHLSPSTIILGENAGIHLMVKIETDLPDETVIQNAAIKGVELASAQNYYLAEIKTGEFILGYAHLDEIQIEQGIRKLSQALKG